MANDNPEININVKANVNEVKKPMDGLLDLVNRQRDAVAGTNKVLGEAAKTQADVQRVARELISAVDALGDDALKQRVASLFMGGIENAAKMESRVKHLTREAKVLENVSETVLMKMGSMEMPGGGDVETQVQKATVALGVYEKRYGEMVKSALAVEQNMKSLGDAQAFNAVVQALTGVNERLEQVRLNAAGGAEHAQDTARALREEANALEDGLPGIEQKRAALMREAEAYESIAAAQRALEAGAVTRLERQKELVKQLGDGQVEAVTADLKRLGNEVTAIEGRAKAADSAIERQEQQKRVAAEQEAERAQAEHAKQVQREAELREKMELAGMSKRELTAETLRLTEAMREASRVGNTELYEQLRRRMMAARSAQETLTREMQLARIAGMQQVQTAQSLGASLGSAASAIMNLSENAQKGQLDLMGVANAIMGVQMAAQAGMGPLGAALLTLQGLQAVWNYFARERNAAAEKMRELTQAAVDADTALRAAQEAASAESGEKRRIAAAEALTAQFQRQLDLLKEAERQAGLNAEAELHRIAMTAQGDEQAVALKRLQLQAAFNRGDIDKFSLDEQMLHLNADAAWRAKQRQLDEQNVRVQTAQAQADTRRDEYDAARWAERENMAGFTLTEKQAEGKVEAWELAKANYEELKSKWEKIEGDIAHEESLGAKSNGLRLMALRKEYEEMKRTLPSMKEAQAAVEAARAEIPEFARLHGTAAYGREIGRRETFNQKLDDEEKTRKDAWDEAKRQADAEKAALERLAELVKQWSEGESALLKQRLADVDEARRQDLRTKAHERRVARLKEEVRKLSEGELQAELSRLRGLARAEKNDGERGRRETEAGVVLAEVGRREQAEQRLRGQLRGNEQAGSKAEDAVIRSGVQLAVDVLENNNRYTAEDVARLERLVAKADKTPGEADNEVMRRILRYLDAQAQAQAKAMEERAAMQRRVAELEQQLRASQRAMAR